MVYDRAKVQASNAIAVLAAAEVGVAVATKSYVWLGLAGAFFGIAAITYANSKRNK